MKSLQTRATGASCKECRRLKIKCDKQVPCGTCTKRGLQSLCPDGQLSGTKGSRYVLASAEESWHRIQALCVRVQDLEFALERSHSLVAHDKHPLLNSELLKIGQDPRAVKPESSTSPPKIAEDVPISNFGTMKISKAGSYRWLGTTAVPVMMLDDYDQENELLGVSNEQASGTLATSESTPMAELKAAAIRLLPPRQEAMKLLEIYFDFCWRWPLIMSRSIVLETLFTVAYDGDHSTLSTYNLSALYSILALGTLFDTSLEPNGQEFKLRRHWANKLFYLHWPNGPTTVDELEALILLFRVTWPFLDKSYSQNHELMAWGIKLSEKIGLHRDPSHLNLSTEECLRRRRVFWALWHHDSLTALVLGLPPTLAKGFVDCRPPQGTSDTPEDIFVQLTLITQDILSHFMESGHHTSFDTVLRIDSNIRSIDVDACSSYLQTIAISSGSQPSSPNYPSAPHVQATLKGYVRGLKHMALMTLHKTYFSYAVLRPGEDPLGIKWAPSTNAMFESATAIMDSAHNITRNMPWMQSRVAPNWIHYHTAAIVLYGFAIYLPYSPHAVEAIKTADTAVAAVFQAHAGDNQRAAAFLPSLLQIQAQATASMARFQAGTWAHPALSPLTPTSKNEGEMTIEMFFNEKLNIAGALSRHVVQTSLDLTPSGHDIDSRGSTPSDALPPNHGGDNYGADNQSIYGGGDASSSSSSSIFRGNPQWVGVDSPLIVPASNSIDDGAYWIESPLQVHEGRPYDELRGYRQPPNISMEWTNSPVPAHMKVESPPHSAVMYTPQQHYIPGTMHAGSSLHPPEEYGTQNVSHTLGQSGTIRRVRGLSRARSFPSDYPHGHPGMTPMVVVPPLPHHQIYQSMQAPGQFLTPTTPASAHIEHSAHVSPVQSHLSPVRDHTSRGMEHHNAPQQSPAAMYAQSEEERYRHWIGGGGTRSDPFRPPPSHGYSPLS